MDVPCAAGLLDTGAIIVNYRTPELTIRAARSILGEPGVRELIIVENASGDGSADILRGGLPEPAVTLVESSRNVGFGQGVNLGARHCSAPFLLLLNSDAVVRPGSVASLVRVLKDRPEVAIVAPTVYCSNGDRLQPMAYGTFPTTMSVLFQRRPRSHETLAPDWVSGVAMLVRRSDFDDVGGFDRDFEMYLEDVDLCRRLRARGKEVRRELTAGVDHLIGQSWSSANDQCRQAQASRVIYAQKAGFSLFGRLAMRTIQAAHLQWHRLAPRHSTGLPARLLQP